MTVLPYKEMQVNKKEQVATMFNNISHRYDLLNRVLSGGIDRRWRKKAIKMLAADKPQYILDVATGTADLAIAALEAKPTKIIGIDISEQMLEVGKEKIKKQGLQDKIELKLGDSENLPFEDNTFDAVIVSFGVRNFEHLEKGLSEIYRVLRQGGTLIVLEFSQPARFPVKQMYGFYSKTLLPWIGRLVSKDARAYTYLPESVAKFPYGKKFTSIMDQIGFKHTECTPLTFGVCSIYRGKK